MSGAALQLKRGVSEPATPRGEARHVPMLMLAYAGANLLAFLRDAAIAFRFGANDQTDAYFLGTLIPTMLVQTLVANSLVPALLPLLARHADDPGAAARLAGGTVTIVGLLLAGVLAIAALTAEGAVGLLAPDWSRPQTELAATLLRVTLLSAGLLVLSTQLAAVSSVRHRYLVVPLGLAIANATAALVVVTLGTAWGIHAAAWGTVAGAGLQLAVLLLAVSRSGPRLVPALTPPNGALRELGLAFTPLLALACLSQTLPVFERHLASGLPAGQLSYLSYATKLFLIPVTIVTTSSLVVSFVALSHDSAASDLAAFRATLGRGARLMAFLLMLATVGELWLARPLVELAFRQGEFTAEAAAITAALVRLYALGTVPNGLSALLTRSYQARGDNWTPLRCGALSSAAYVLVAAALFRVWGVYGLAAAFPIVQTAVVLLLYAGQPSQVRAGPGQLARWTMAVLLVAVSASALAFLTGQALAVLGVGSGGLLGELRGPARPAGAGLAGRLESLAVLAVGGAVTLGSALGVASWLQVEEGAIVLGWLRVLPERLTFRPRLVRS